MTSALYTSIFKQISFISWCHCICSMVSSLFSFFCSPASFGCGQHAQRRETQNMLVKGMAPLLISYLNISVNIPTLKADGNTLLFGPQICWGTCSSAFLASSRVVCHEKCVIAVWFSTQKNPPMLDESVYRWNLLSYKEMQGVQTIFFKDVHQGCAHYFSGFPASRCVFSVFALYHSDFPLQVTPYPLIHWILVLSPGSVVPSGDTDRSPCPACQCSMPLPCSCPLCPGWCSLPCSFWWSFAISGAAWWRLSRSGEYEKRKKTW